MHRDVHAPTVLFSTGYDLIDFDSLSEPALMVEGNQVSIEKSVYVSLCRRHWEEETGRWPVTKATQ